MSIYTECGEAARELLDDPGLRPVTKNAPEQVFTELDVIALAARNAPQGYGKYEMKVAQREASQVMGMLFRSRQAVRFGPVEFPSMPPDYARISGKIVYAAPDALEVLKSPNGEFPQMLIHEDEILQSGRRVGSTGRDDFLSWDEQDLHVGGRTSPSTSREILRLEAEVARLKEELAGERERNVKADWFERMETKYDDLRTVLERTLRTSMDGSRS